MCELPDPPRFPSGEVSRPQDGLFLCRLKFDLLPTGTLSKTDLGAVDDRWTCTPVAELEGLAKLGYWGWKTFKWIESSIPPEG